MIDVACRTMLLKLKRLGHYLPEPLSSGGGNSHKDRTPIIHFTDAIVSSLHDLPLVRIEVIQGDFAVI
jgi:hypothetical protein